RHPGRYLQPRLYPLLPAFGQDPFYWRNDHGKTHATSASRAAAHPGNPPGSVARSGPSPAQDDGPAPAGPLSNAGRGRASAHTVGEGGYRRAHATDGHSTLQTEPTFPARPVARGRRGGAPG